MPKNNYLQTPINFNGILTKKPILLAESKARYIEQYRDLIDQFGYSIELNYFGGASFWNYYVWLQKNLAAKVDLDVEIVLYIWLGTCDLTVKHTEYQKDNKLKNGSKLQFIDLRHTSDTFAVSCVTEQISKFSKYVSKFPTVQMVFLETPFYSILKYNQHLRCPQADNFLDKEYILNERVGILNDFIRQVNWDSGFNAPRFKKDLQKNRKKAGGAMKIALDFSGYIDGLHPVPH